jgi:phosphoglycolate phosphatase-like HAD superfamily hydrolase
VRLLVVDLIPALLSWEGRDPFPDPPVPPGTAEAIEDLYSMHRLAAVTDADRSNASVRRVLEALDVAAYFDGVSTSAAFGPEVSPRLVRHLTAALDAPDPPLVVTARPRLAGRMRAAMIPAVVVRPGDPGNLVARVEEAIGDGLSL